MQAPNVLQQVAQAIEAIFQSWTALQLTIEHQLGGDQAQARQFLESTLAIVTSSSPRCTKDSLIDYFYSQFDRLDTDIEDGSPEQVAHQIILVRDAALNGDLAPAAQVIQAANNQPSDNTLSSSISGGEAFACCGRDDCGHDIQHDHDRSDVNDDMDDHQHTAHAPLVPIVDEDGFTEVRTRRRAR